MVLRTQYYIKIQAALPALKVLPVGQKRTTWLAPRHEIATAKEFIDVFMCVELWYNSVYQESKQTSPFPSMFAFKGNKSREALRIWGFMVCHPFLAETCALVVQRRVRQQSSKGTDCPGFHDTN